jgi:hypothetical protein
MLSVLPGFPKLRAKDLHGKASHIPRYILDRHTLWRNGSMRHGAVAEKGTAAAWPDSRSLK